MPEEWRKWAVEKGHADPVAASLTFHDYWIAVSGQKGTKLDWSATWRNWVRSDIERQGVKPNGKAKVVWQMSDSELMELAAERKVSTSGKTRKQLEAELR